MKSSNLLPIIALSWAIIAGNNTKLAWNTTNQQLRTLFSQDSTLTSQDSTINESTFQKPEFILISSSDLKDGPFNESHPMIHLNATNLLWGSQSKTILSEFNSHNPELTFKQKLKEGINIPLIYPELKTYFPQTLLEVQQDPQFNDYDFSNPNTLILIKTQNGKHALAYYQNGELTMASFISIGTSQHKTIPGQYIITPDKIRRRSQKYNNAPMPYSLNVIWGYYIHQGTSTGYPLSHGCIRVPWLYQQWLYKQIKQEGNTQIIIHKPYQATSFKKGE